ncbi:glyoxylate reductase/hydroxypyruvate reductase isoform X2 [Periplaneta americana]|uniref:glyoxylate reductase/hydroxypyruvate reductase isoform X2 n=1 Tax=Periplaneta americana TaxID=6978 RepID=UPI0037E80A3C
MLPIWTTTQLSLRWLTLKHSLTIDAKARCSSDISSSVMSKAKIFVTRPDVPEGGINLLKERYDVTAWTEERPIPRDVLLRQIKGKNALFCMLTDKIDKEVLDTAGKDLRVIATMSVGYDHIDVKETKSRGIRIGFTPEVLTDAVAELTIGLILATARRMFEAHDQIVEGKWSAWAPTWMCGVELKRSTVGIVGFGRIGQAVAQRLQGFGVERILYTSRSEKREAKGLGATLSSLENLVEVSDFIIVTCALMPETTGLFSDALFDKMKPTAIFINTSRGAVVDQLALQRALEKGKILAAGIDVMTPEPIPPTHPLLKLKNCVSLPHIGSATTWARSQMSVMTARNIIAALDSQVMPAEVM